MEGAESDMAIGQIDMELCALMSVFGEFGVAVSELHGPGRFTSRASAFDMEPGSAYDLRTGYDFSKESDRRRAGDGIDSEKPLLAMGSPMCAPFSTIQFLNAGKTDLEARIREGIEHLTFCCDRYRKQIVEGRLFLHEHPKTASSWDLWMVRAIAEMDGVIIVQCDQCAYGLWCVDKQGPALVKKPTRWMTNSVEIAKGLCLKCSGGHRHCQMIGLGKPGLRIVERYPPKLVASVLRGLRREIMNRGQLNSMEAGPHVDEPEPWDVHPGWYENIVDNITGQELDPELVSKGREEEMNFLRDLGAYTLASRAECRAETGKDPIPTIWVDVNKGDAQRPNVRCRLCVAETRSRTAMDTSSPMETFSATPPYEALRLMVSMCMSPRDASEENDVLMFLDITRAHPHCLMRRRVFIKLPAEDPRSADPDACGLLVRCLYGCRDAGQNFELFVRDTMEDKLKFTGGVWCPCIYLSEDKLTLVYVYGDNFVVKGTRARCHDFYNDLLKYMWVKLEGTLGPSRAAGDVPEVVCLNKIFRWTPEGIELEADPRHAQILAKQLSLSNVSSNAVVTPGVKPTDADPGEPLMGTEATAFRSMVMRAAYLAEDRPDIKYATKEAARYMSNPCARGLEVIKRVARYLLGVPRLVQKFPRQRAPGWIRGFSDSDHAGCLATRKSTSCGVFMHGGHMIKIYSTTQTVEALSSGESEWYALVHTASCAIGLQNLAKDMGSELQIGLAGDATAASGIAHRRGAGRIRHIETKTLWLQRHITDRRIKLEKEDGKTNPPDIGTKHVDASTLWRLLARMNYHVATGKSSLALDAAI